MPLKKTHLIDRRPWWAATLIAFGYILSFIICVGVGGNGPMPASLQPLTNDLGPYSPCVPTNTPASCSVTQQVTFSGLTGYNQALFMVVTMDRPIDLSTGQPALLNAQFSFPLDFTLSATGVKPDGSVETIASSNANSVQLTCMPGKTTCGYGRLFSVPFLFDTSYQATVTFMSPYSGFIRAGLSPTNLNGTANAGINLIGGTINPSFTRFQIGSKYTFLALSTIMLGVYIYFLNFGKGTRDPRNPNQHLPSTPEQNWMLVLCIWLWWSNDPFAAVSLTSPSYAASGFYAFCAVTFICVLLCYWMVLFDLARDPANSNIPSRMQPLGASAQLAKRCNCSAFWAAVLFWLPKILWCTITWVLLLSFYLVQRGGSIQDPTFDVFSAFPFIRQYFTSFLAAWGAFYVIYLGVFMIMTLYHWREIAPSSRYILAITLITILAVLSGFFLNGVLTVTASNSSVLFMTAVGATNVYCYFLVIAYLPAYPWTASEAIIVAEREKQAAMGPGLHQGLTLYGGREETGPAQPLKKAQSESYTQTDESAFLAGEEHGDSGTCVIVSEEDAAAANAAAGVGAAAASGVELAATSPSSVSAAGAGAGLGSPVAGANNAAAAPAQRSGRISFASILGGGRKGKNNSSNNSNNGAPTGGKGVAAAFTGSAGGSNSEATATSSGVALAVPVPSSVVVDDVEASSSNGGGAAAGAEGVQSWK